MIQAHSRRFEPQRGCSLHIRRSRGHTRACEDQLSQSHSADTEQKNPVGTCVSPSTVSKLNAAAPDNGTTESQLEFRISDSGIGIGIGMSQDLVDRLFGEFTEIDQAVTRRFGGTGLWTGYQPTLVSTYEFNDKCNR